MIEVEASSTLCPYYEMHQKSNYRRLFIAIIILLLLFIIIAYYNSNNLIRHFIVHALKNKDAFRSCNAPITLGGVSLTFRCKRKKSGVDYSDDEIGREGGSCWILELSHLHIGNAHGWHNDNTPYALHLNKLRVSVSGPLEILSLLQYPLASSPILFGASSSIPRIFCNGLDFFVGFRIRSIDTLEIHGLSVFYSEEEDSGGGEKDAYDVGSEDGAIKTGLLGLKRGLKRGDAKRQREFQVVLWPTNLTWYELKQGGSAKEESENNKQHNLALTANYEQTPKHQTTKAKQKGSIKLFPSSSVEVLDDDGDGQQYGIELISDTHCLIIYARSIEERGAWVDALNGVIAELVYSNGGGSGSAPWWEVLVAESNARKVRWRRKEKRHRHNWHRKWQTNDDENNYYNDNDEDEEIDEEEDENVGNDDTENENDNKIRDKGGSDFLLNIQRALDGQRSHERTKRFEESMEWRIGRLDIQQVNIHINDKTHVHLDNNGWRMNGFIGSSKELRTKLRIDLGAKLLQDSTGHAIKWSISEYTGKEEYVFGDISKAVVTKVGAGIAESVQEFTGKSNYEFGDIAKTVVGKASDGVSDAVQEFTGKDKYEFGDLTKTLWSKITRKSNGKEKQNDQHQTSDEL